jgi:hypothetical protein
VRRLRALTLVAGCAWAPPGTAGDAGEKVSTIESLVLAGDWDAVERVRGDPRMVETLKPFLTHDDDIVRLLAVDAISAAGGPGAVDPLLGALADDNEKVAVNAASGLRALPLDGRAPSILAAYDKAWNPFVRREVALLLGRCAGDAEREALRTRRDAASGGLREAWTAALGRLGDLDAREEFARLLREARGERIRDLVELVRYVDQRWVLPALRPVLERDEIAHDLSTHRTRVVRRGKDLAVDAVLEIGKPELGFRPLPHGQYEPAQVGAVARYLDDLARVAR